MKLQADPPLHLTYCLNVHAGESWSDTLAAIRRYALAVRDRVQPDGPFALGLRLSAAAAADLAGGDALDRFAAFLAAEDCYVFTINGFPYGRFHKAPVKQDVYRPDWRTGERRDYTVRLGEILARLLPDGLAGSISTVPLSYKPWGTGDEDAAAMVRRLCEVVAHFADLRCRTGRTIRLALEPEPDCLLETTDEVIDFFTGPLVRQGADVLGEFGLDADAARVAIAEHVGVCLDTAHAAVAFEPPHDVLQRLGAAGIRVCKVQLSAALRVTPGAEALRRLAAFNDAVYLHQVAVRRGDGTVVRYADLPAALTDADAADADEWRVHFHVPLFFGGDEAIGSTRSLLRSAFADALRAGATDQLEIETYTFDVLPDGLAVADPAEGIAREYRWVLDELLSRSPQ
ncbi:MAG: metabolite traffic protein EboE [Phycisphaerae bacterium]|nr:metabolite traffic protein EboE [Phycisphaerae bacterium]